MNEAQALIQNFSKGHSRVVFWAANFLFEKNLKLQAALAKVVQGTTADWVLASQRPVPFFEKTGVHNELNCRLPPGCVSWEKGPFNIVISSTPRTLRAASVARAAPAPEAAGAVEAMKKSLGGAFGGEELDLAGFGVGRLCLAFLLPGTTFPGTIVPITAQVLGKLAVFGSWSSEDESAVPQEGTTFSSRDKVFSRVRQELVSSRKREKS